MGRVSLRETLDSVVHQLAADDEILVVGDGYLPNVEEIVARFQGRALGSLRFLSCGPTRLYGYAQRNHGIENASRCYLAFIDDDDVYLPGALESVRAAIRGTPGRPMLFRMRYREELLWKDAELRLSNVATPMFVTPNYPERLGVWRPRQSTGYQGDYVFIRDTIEKWPAESLVFRSEVIAKMTRHGRGRK